MFTKTKQTAFLPTKKPMMVWDGECGFCKYWITYWKSRTGNSVDYRTFQKVSAQFEDISLEEFKKASRLIEVDGSVYSGPDSAFRTFRYFKNPSLCSHHWYSRFKIFNSLTNYSYNFIAKNRSFMFGDTNLFFGKNPENIKPFWLLLLMIIFTLGFLLLKFL